MKPAPFEVAVAAAPLQAAGLKVFWMTEDPLPLPTDPPVVVFGWRDDGKSLRLNAAQRRSGPWIRLPKRDFVVVDLTSQVYGLSLEVQRAMLTAIVQRATMTDAEVRDAIEKRMRQRKTARVENLSEADVRRFVFWKMSLWNQWDPVPPIGA